MTIKRSTEDGAERRIQDSIGLRDIPSQIARRYGPAEVRKAWHVTETRVRVELLNGQTDIWDWISREGWKLK